jgi:hypothetical protein
MAASKAGAGRRQREVIAMIISTRAAVSLSALILLIASAVPSSAALLPGEYACAGSGGRLLIGLGFKLGADGTYTDLDGKSRGRVTYSADGTTLTFVGGHLDGQHGRNVRNGGRNFEINMISCSLN